MEIALFLNPVAAILFLLAGFCGVMAFGLWGIQQFSK